MIFPITNFKPGLDTRRSKLTSVPGTLETLQNMHVNQGGELEKRFAFSLQGTQDVFAGTYGGIGTKNGIVVFGSAAVATGKLPSGSDVPTGFVYQQLIHPTDSSKTLTGISSQTLYGDFPFVVASFNDSQSFCYYNGILVTDFTAGVVMKGWTTNAQVAAALTACANNSNGYTAVQNAASLAHTFDMFSNPGESYSASVVLATKTNISISSGADTDFTDGQVFNTNGLNAVDTSFIFVGGKKYTFQTTLTNVDGNVVIGSNPQVTLQNLYNAINLGTGSGTVYAAAMTANTQCYATGFLNQAAPSFTIQALVANTTKLVKNALTGVAYEEDADTVPLVIATDAAGQFRITAFSPASYASALVFTNGTNPGTSTVIKLNGVQYNFGTSAGNVKIGANVATTFASLAKVINGTGVVGTDVVAPAPAANAYFTAGAVTGSGASTQFTITSIVAGSVGYSYPLYHNDGRIQMPATPSGGVGSSITAITIGPIGSFGTLTTNNVNPSNGDTVTIGSTVYTFVTPITPGLVNTNDVLIGANAQTTLLNLIQAINNSGVQGVDYITNGPNTQVNTLPCLNGNILRINSRLAGTSTNSIALSVTGTTLTASGATFTGGADTINLIDATVEGTPLQAPSSFIANVLDAINSYSATSGFSATAIDDTIYLKSLKGSSTYNNAAVVVTTSGSVCVGFCGIEFFFPTIASDASTINQGTTGSLQQIQVNGIKLLSSTFECGPGKTYTSISAMLVAVSVAINTAKLYAAVAIENALYLSRIITSSSDASLNVSVSVFLDTKTTMNVTQFGQDELFAIASPNYVNFVRHDAGGSYKTGPANSTAALVGTGVALGAFTPFVGVGLLAGLAFGGGAGAITSLFGGSKKKQITDSYSPIVCNCRAQGGYPPYTYKWSWISGDPGFVASAPTQPNTNFFRQDTAGAQTSFWACTVSDSLGNAVLSNQIRIHQP